jgi:hypothetical protein
MTSPFAPVRKHEVVPAAELRKRKRAAPRKRKRRRRSSTEEARQQKRFVVWARGHGLEVQHQNNGAATAKKRIELHAMGCTAGAADILVFDLLPNDQAARGLALEFKTADGEQSPDQIAWQQRVTRLGWRYHVVRSAEEAVEVVTWYGLGCGKVGACAHG